MRPRNKMVSATFVPIQLFDIMISPIIFKKLTIYFHRIQDLESTDEDCDCPDCCEERQDAAATYDFMKCDFEQVFSEQQDSKEATADTFS